MVSSGNNKKLASSFNKFFPPFRKHGAGDVAEKAKQVLKTFRERSALKKANDKLNAGRT